MPGTPSILIVEDEYGLAELLRDMLTELGYEVSLAINGRLALEVLREREIHLVLTDAMMPVMDGPELARAMRADERHRRIPIVMMTSLAAAVPSDAGPLRGRPVEAVHAGSAVEGSRPVPEPASWQWRWRGRDSPANPATFGRVEHCGRHLSVASHESAGPSCLTHSRLQPEGHSGPLAWSHADRIPPRAHGAGPVHSQTL